MFRIIQDESEITMASEPKVAPALAEHLPELGFRHHLLLNMLGLAIAEAPEAVLQLLGDYSIELSKDCPEEEIADTLISAIGECNYDFNRDLASLILDRTLNSSYDQYDFKQIAGEAANLLSNIGKDQSPEGQTPPGVLGGLATTIGQIGGIISHGIQPTQSKSASQQARQGIAKYRKQQLERQEVEDQKKNNLMLFLLLTALGVGIIGLITHVRRQLNTNIKIT